MQHTGSKCMHAVRPKIKPVQAIVSILPPRACYTVSTPGALRRTNRAPLEAQGRKQGEGKKHDMLSRMQLHYAAYSGRGQGICGNRFPVTWKRKQRVCVRVRVCAHTEYKHAMQAQIHIRRSRPTSPSEARGKVTPITSDRSHLFLLARHTVWRSIVHYWRTGALKVGRQPPNPHWDRRPLFARPGNAVRLTWHTNSRAAHGPEPRLASARLPTRATRGPEPRQIDAQLQSLPYGLQGSESGRVGRIACPTRAQTVTDERAPPTTAS